jgi:hypothetical protein
MVRRKPERVSFGAHAGVRVTTPYQAVQLLEAQLVQSPSFCHLVGPDQPRLGQDPYSDSPARIGRSPAHEPAQRVERRPRIVGGAHEHGHRDVGSQVRQP